MEKVQWIDIIFIVLLFYFVHKTPIIIKWYVLTFNKEEIPKEDNIIFFFCCFYWNLRVWYVLVFLREIHLFGVRHQQVWVTESFLTTVLSDHRFWNCCKWDFLSWVTGKEQAMRVPKSLSAQRRSKVLLRKGQQVLNSTFSYSANSERTRSNFLYEFY